MTELTDSTGSVAKAYAYDAYGNILESPGTGNQPSTHTGRELDQETGLYYYRARYYDAASRRFLQKDPIGFTSGDANLYKYTKGNPANATDPFGLTTLMFNIKDKTLSVDPERDGQARYQLPATSGRGDCLNKPDCARQNDSGPIPQGEYSIDTGEITNPGFLGDLRRNFLGDMDNFVPGQEGRSGLPFDPTQTVDHTGQAMAPGSHQIDIPFPVDEECVNRFIRPGRQLGPWAPTNQCQSFVSDVLEQCRRTPTHRPLGGVTSLPNAY